MTFGSLFAGIGGFDLGFERAGMQCAGQVEKDAFCRNVLGDHWCDLQRIDDVLKFRMLVEPKYANRHTTRIIRPDLICGGFPCQDVSVAGRRAGLAGERSGLWFVARRIIAVVRPRWVCIENVPGLLSSNGGRDMGTVLGQLGQLGYGWAYRVLDAQYFGVAQRRRRVFIVGHLGDRAGRLPARVLFDADSLSRNPPSRGQAGARIAASLTRGTDSGGRGGYAGRRREDDVNLVCALDSHMGMGGVDDNAAQAGHVVAMPLKAKANSSHDESHENYVPVTVGTLSGGAHPGGHNGQDNLNVVAHTLRAEGHDASEDGTGRGVPIIPILEVGKGTSSRGEGPNGCGIGHDGDPMYTLQAGAQHAVAYQCHGSNVGEMGTLRSGNGNESGGVPFISQKYVRRLTPRECERLQGFPDDFTRYGADGKEISNSARYRMLGNAVCVNVAEWIGRRIMECDADSRKEAI